jgi:hypothetical protein
MKSPKFVDSWPLECDFNLNLQPYMISSMSLSPRNISEFLPKLLNKRKYEPDLSYVEYTIKVFDQKERVTRRKVVKIYEIQWNNHTEDVSNMGN